MGLLDGIEKLITEHGSAAILKERIALANDKYAALEKKLSDSELRVKQLEMEKQVFELDNFKLKEKVGNLEEQLVEPHENRLEDIKENLLIALSPGQDAIAAQLAQSLDIGEQLATFHLEELANTGFVSAARFYTGRPTIWKLGQDGRGYLVSHGLLE